MAERQKERGVGDDGAALLGRRSPVGTTPHRPAPLLPPPEPKVLAEP